MTNQELETKLHHLVGTERRTTKAILVLIREAEDRRLPLLKGHKDTHKWLIKEYKYSGSAANRRIQASRLLRLIPAIEQKLVEGTVNLTTLTKVQSAIYRAEKRTKQRMATAEKEAILSRIEGKTEDAAERELFSLFPEEAKKETLRHVNGTDARLSTLLDEQTLADLKWVRDSLSHAVPGASWAQVIAYLAKDFRKRKTPTAPVPRRAIKKACEYKSEVTGLQCGSTYQLEVDHIIPRALGGTDDPKNLRCLCKQHNLLEAERKLGRERMQKSRR